ncbi:MAG: ATP-binding protein [Cyclobacteriaceae bacterium]
MTKSAGLMKLTKKLESEIRKAYLTYWESYFTGDLKTFSSIIDDSYTMIGTSEGEVINGKKETTRWLKASVNEIKGKAEFRSRKIKISLIEQLAFVHEQANAFILANNKWQFYSKIRISTFLSNATGSWKVVQQHGSLPDSRTEEGETVSFETLTKENLQLRDAVKRRTVELELKNQELEIQACLERVRGVAMSMRKPEDLATICKVLYHELLHLGFDEMRNAQINIHDNERKSLLNYDYIPDNGSTTTIFDYDSHPLIKNLVKQLQRGNDFSSFSIGPGRLKEWRALRKKRGEKEDSKLKKATSLFYCFYSIGNGAIGLSAINKLPVEKLDLLKRFRNVFDLAYRRYEDIKKAEAQAREAQVEVALEKVRSRSLAMQSSDELLAASDTMLAELEKLDINALRIGICTIDGKTGSAEVWSRSENKKAKVSKILGVVPKGTHPVFDKMVKASKANEPIYSNTRKGMEVKEYYIRLSKHLSYPLPRKYNKQETITAFFFTAGSLNVVSLEPLSKSENAILLRFAKVFGQVYERFLDLQKAEAQAREAEIELALERVRARTMAMHRSDELAHTSSVLFEQLIRLGVNPWVLGFILPEPDSMMAKEWMTKPNGEGIPEMIMLPVDCDSVWLNAHNAWKAGRKLLSQERAGRELINHHENMKKVIDIPLDDIFKQYGTPDQLFFYTSFFKEGYLFFITKEPHPEMENIFVRCANVFSQSYTRFLDLKKAEAQAREAQIEAALERVRSRSMAMHKSEELLEVITVVSDQLQLLEFKFNHVSFANNDLDEDYKFWVSARGISHPMRFNVPFLDIPIMKNLREAQQKGVKFYTDVLTKQENKQWHKHLLKHGGAKVFTEEVNEYSMSRGMARSIAINTNIMLLLANYASIPYTEEDNKIIARFGHVFEQSYTRFLDLQKAEAQAREAQIEAALERVRGKAMSMQQSHELKDVVEVMIENLQSLNIEALLCEIVLFENNFQSWKSWLYLAGEENIIDFEFSGIYYDHPFNDHQKKEYQKGSKYTTYVLEGKAKENFDRLFHQHMSGKNIAGLEAIVYQIPRTVFSIAYLTQGAVLVAGDTPLSDEGAAILQRFAKVVDFTYTRVEDLQKAEQRSLEAIRSASLDRVRAEIASMRTTKDLERITPVIWRELTTLGIPFVRSGVFIMDDEHKKISTYLSTPDGKAIAAFHLPYESATNLSAAISNWREHKIFVTRWVSKDFEAQADVLVKQGAIATADQYLSIIPKEGIHLHFLPFSQGMLYVGSLTALNNDDLDLIQSLTDAFSTAYARYEDFNRLEVAKQQVEKTLTDLKETQKQLIQSEKMASLGELTAGIAHEIQNPLNFVNNFSEVSNELLVEMKEELEKGNSEEVKAIVTDVIENLEKILHHGKRADGIVKGMLQHSRSSSGQKEPTDINALCDEYLRLAYHGLRAKDKSFNSKFETHFDASLEKINVVPQDIGRVVLNLITNAFYVVNEKSSSVKASEDKSYEPTVVVSTKKEDNSVLISVKDNGNGIPDSIKEKIFQPFFTTKPTGQGTGLGLSLSYDIVKGHGGELRVETKHIEGLPAIASAQAGSTFFIYLPVV